jgi:adenosine kinase
VSIVVTGSIAYDYIMVFPGHFKEHILPDKVHMLSVSFLVESMKRQRGGTAANIAYNLALLGERPRVVAAVGEDFADYRLWLEDAGVDTNGIKPIPGEFTSSCFINTDLQDNQITAFYPGAMSHAHTLSFRDEELRDADIVVISPNDPLAMQHYAAECVELGIPYLYDPSMQAPRMTAEELRAGCAGAKVLIGNDYEFGMMSEKLGITEAELLRMVPVTVVTKGEQGSSIFAEDQEYVIPPARPHAVVDPTGAGDAFRAGFVKGMQRGLPWEIVGRLASLSAVYAIEHAGTQQHSYTLQQFVERYRENFGTAPDVEALFDMPSVTVS